MAWATIRTVREVISGQSFTMIEGLGGAPNVAIPTTRGFAVRLDGAAGTTLYVTVNSGTAWTAINPTSVTDFGAGGIQTDAIVESTLDAGVTLENFKLEDETTSRTITTSNVPVVWTHTANGAADDLSLIVAGATDSSLILQSAGTGTDAVSLIASAGGINVDSAGLLDVDVVGAIEVDASGAISVESSGGTLNMGADAVAQTVNVATGGARTLNLGSAAANGVNMDAGVGGLNFDADTTIELDAGGAVSVESTGGAISVGADAVAQPVNLATGAAARVWTLGNAASASGAIEGGVGTLDLDSDGALSLNSSAAAINVGNDAVAQPVNIATGAAARVISVGNAASASLLLEAGVGGVDMNADTTIDVDAGTAITIDSAGGAISVGADAVAQAVNIATGAAARAILIGNAASASCGIDAGVGAGAFVADGALTLTAGLTSVWSITGNQAAAQTLTIDSINAGAGAGYVVVTADEDVSLGDAAGNPTLSLYGTGAVTVATTKRVVNAAAEVLTFDDDVFQVAVPASPTSIMRLSAANVTAGQTRVLTMADRNVDVADLDVVSLADVGTGIAIPVTDSVTMNIVTGAGAETNTLAIPTFAGQKCSLHLGVAGGGTRTVTVASGINQAGNTTIAFTQALDFIHLVGVRTVAAGTLAWRVVVNDGCVLG